MQEKEKYGIPHQWDLKKRDSELTEQRQTHRLSEQAYACVCRGEEVGKGWLVSTCEANLWTHCSFIFKMCKSKKIKVQV